MSRWGWGIVGVVLCLAAAGCGALSGGMGKKSGSPIATATPEMERAFLQPEKQFYEKQFDEAKQGYQTYLTTFSTNALTGKAYFRLGEISFHEKDFPRAITLYKKSLSRGIDPDWGSTVLYKEAVCYFKREDYKKAISTLDEIPWEKADGKVGVRSGSLRVSVAKKMGDVLEEKKGLLEVIDAYEVLDPTESKVGELNWLVTDKVAGDEIRHWIVSGEVHEIGRYKNWLKRFDGKTSGGFLTWKIAKLYYQKGDYKNTALWTRQYLERYPKHEFVREGRKLLAEVDKRGNVPGASNTRGQVGVLLPLTGKYAVYGESVLHGLECAAGIFSPCRGDLGLNLVIRDSRSDPKTAAKIVDELAKDPEVQAIIGPLPTVEIDDAVAQAEQVGMPMITLSQKPNVAKSGNFIFRNFLTVSDQVSTLVDYACKHKHWKKFAIIYPEDAAGEEYKKNFQEEVEQCGGKLVATSSYPEGTRSFTDALRTLKLASSFDVLFIPDVYRKIPQVVADIKFLEMTGVHLLGGAGWDHPGLLKAGEAVEGAVFADGFFAKGSNFTTRDFVTTFQAAYGFEPTLLEAYAYDTMRLVGEVMREQPAATRSDFQKALAGKKNFEGVTGTISFDEDGDARRRLFLLTVDKGEIKEAK